jgi:hypothetical protein
MMSAVAYWDNGTTIRHRESTRTPSQFPGRIDITLLFIAFFLKQISLEVSNLRRAILRNGESAFLWMRFVARYHVPKAPAKVASVVVSIGIAIQKEEVHVNIRRLAVTAMYSVGGIIIIAIAPKIIMIVWAI